MFFDVTRFLFSSVYEAYEKVTLPVIKGVEIVLFAAIIIKLIRTRDSRKFIKNNNKLISIIVIIDFITELVSKTNDLIKIGSEIELLFVFILIKKLSKEENNTITIQKPLIENKIENKKEEIKKVVRKRKTTSTNTAKTKKKSATKKTKE